MRGMNVLNGKPLSGLAHLRQSVEDILSTPLRSRVLRREYGAEVVACLDRPADDATRVNIISAAASALARWEPRLQVVRIRVVRLSASHAELVIDGISRETGAPLSLSEVTVYARPQQH